MIDIKKLPLDRVAFHHLQALNEDVYGIQNGRVYGADAMCMKIVRYSTIAIKGIRKGKPKDVHDGVIMAFSWAMAFSNRLKIDLDTEVWRRFPGVCPYCKGNICSCKERASTRVETVVETSGVKMPLSVQGFQLMFAEIYPQNTLKDAGIHLAEESAELLEAYLDYAARHTEPDFEEVLIELVDVVANLFAVASTIAELGVGKMEIAEDFIKIFGSGCPKCHSAKCACGFTTTADSVVVPA